MSEQIFLGYTSTKQGLMCLAQGHNAVTPVKLEPATPRSPVDHCTPSVKYASTADSRSET